jgi:hypothetical protein
MVARVVLGHKVLVRFQVCLVFNKFIATQFGDTMIPKFQLTRILNTTKWLDRGKLQDYVNSLADGEYEVVVRPKIKWDVDKMRKFMHGPVIDFLIAQFKQQGNVFTKPQLKEWIKREFGPVQTGASNKMYAPMSTAEWSFDTYKKVLQDLNDWCADVFKCQLPSADDIE